MSFNNAHKQIHNIDLDGCGPLENWEKNFGPPQLRNKTELSTLEKITTTQRWQLELGVR
jgi:hypothetical protein